MKTTSLFKACLLVILLTGCGGGGGIAGLFIPNFSNLWTSSRGTTFQFIPSATNVSKGDLAGDEDGLPFTGNFNSYDIDFKFTQGAEIGQQYSGKFVKETEILITAPNGDKITLTRN